MASYNQNININVKVNDSALTKLFNKLKKPQTLKVKVVFANSKDFTKAINGYNKKLNDTIGKNKSFTKLSSGIKDTASEVNKLQKSQSSLAKSLNKGIKFDVKPNLKTSSIKPVTVPVRYEATGGSSGLRGGRTSFGRRSSTVPVDIVRDSTKSASGGYLTKGGYYSRSIKKSGTTLSQVRESFGNTGQIFGDFATLFGLGKLKEYMYDTPVKAETNKFIMGTMADQSANKDTLYNTIDKTTDQLPISMQEVVQPLYAFKSATGATASQINEIIPEFANFGAVVQNMTGSPELAATAMQKLSYGIQGSYAALDQFGITEESLKATGKWSGEASDVKGFMDAVTAVVGDAKDSMNTFQGQVANVGKTFSRAGKQIWEGGLGDFMKSTVQSFMNFNNMLGGLPAKLLLIGGTILTVGSAIVGVTGYFRQMIGNLGQFKEAMAQMKNAGGFRQGIKGIFSRDQGVENIPVYEDDFAVVNSNLEKINATLLKSNADDKAKINNKKKSKDDIKNTSKNKLNPADNRNANSKYSGNTSKRYTKQNQNWEKDQARKFKGQTGTYAYRNTNLPQDKASINKRNKEALLERRHQRDMQRNKRTDLDPNRFRQPSTKINNKRSSIAENYVKYYRKENQKLHSIPRSYHPSIAQYQKDAIAENQKQVRKYQRIVDAEKQSLGQRTKYNEKYANRMDKINQAEQKLSRQSRQFDDVYKANEQSWLGRRQNKLNSRKLKRNNRESAKLLNDILGIGVGEASLTQRGKLGIAKSKNGKYYHSTGNQKKIRAVVEMSSIQRMKQAFSKGGVRKGLKYSGSVIGGNTGLSTLKNSLTGVVSSIGLMNVALIGVTAAITGFTLLWTWAYGQSQQVRDATQNLKNHFGVLGESLINLVGKIGNSLGLTENTGTQGAIDTVIGILNAISSAVDTLVTINDKLSGSDTPRESKMKVAEAERKSEDPETAAHGQQLYDYVKVGGKADRNLLGLPENATDEQGYRAVTYAKNIGGWDGRYNTDPNSITPNVKYGAQNYAYGIDMPLGFATQQTAKKPSDYLNDLANMNNNNPSSQAIQSYANENPSRNTNSQLQDIYGALKGLFNNSNIPTKDATASLDKATKDNHTTNEQQGKQSWSSIENKGSQSLGDAAKSFVSAANPFFALMANLPTTNAANPTEQKTTNTTNPTAPKVEGSSVQGAVNSENNQGGQQQGNQNNGQNVQQNVQQTIANVQGQLSQFASSAFANIQSTVMNGLNQIPMGFQNILPQVTSAGQNLGNGAKMGIGNGLQGMNTTASNAANQVPGAISAVQGAVGGAARSLGNSANNSFVMDLASTASTEASNIASKIKDHIPDVKAAVQALGDAATATFHMSLDVNSPGKMARLMGAEMGYILGFVKNNIYPLSVATGRLAYNSVKSYNKNNTGFNPMELGETIVDRSYNDSLQKLNNSSDIDTSSSNLSNVSQLPYKINLPKDNTQNSQGNNITNNFNIEKVDSKERVKEIGETVAKMLTWNNETAGRITSDPFAQ